MYFVFTFYGVFIMKIAIPIWENHVSTVLDFSEHLVIVDIEGTTVKGETSINWSLCNDTMKISLMKEEGVDVLICGAVSKPMQMMVEDSGITLFYGLRGLKDAILQAYLDGTLHHDHFRLPGTAMTGCAGRKRKCQNRKSKSEQTSDN